MTALCLLVSLWFCPDERVISAELVAPIEQAPRLCASDARTGERVVIPWVGWENYEVNRRFLLQHGYTEEQIRCPTSRP